MIIWYFRRNDLLTLWELRMYMIVFTEIRYQCLHDKDTNIPTPSVAYRIYYKN